MAELLVDQIAVSSGTGETLLHPSSTALKPGELVALIGPNGAGKTTLFRAVMGLHATGGRATINGLAIKSLPARERARLISWLPQSHPAAWPLHVRDAIAMGRFAYGAVQGALASADEEAVAWAIAVCKLAEFEHRLTTSLSGGELARVHLARCLATEAPFLLADEPVAALDPHHRFAIMALLRQLAEQGRGIMVVLHDIEMAARFATRIIVMDRGAIIADGAPQTVITPAMLREVYRMDARIDDSEGWPRPVLSGPAS